MKIDLENFDLTQLPDAEDDNFEFKSSNTPHNDLKEKLSCAVSGFANSGGGCFIVGVDGNGNIDSDGSQIFRISDRWSVRSQYFRLLQTPPFICHLPSEM